MTNSLVLELYSVMQGNKLNVGSHEKVGIALLGSESVADVSKTALQLCSHKELEKSHQITKDTGCIPHLPFLHTSV